MNNRKLEKYINKWKIIVEESKSNINKYYKEINKIFIILD